MGLADSFRDRLLRIAQDRGHIFDRILTLYGIERFLYRLSQSKWRDKFILKGALLFTVWHNFPSRPTRDTDLLGMVDNNRETINRIFQEICLTEVADDGLAFSSDSVESSNIREDNIYQGIRVKLNGLLAKARIRLQFDIGFGDLIIPAPRRVKLPVLIKQPAPDIFIYSPYSVIAEKFQAMVELGIANSRMKDFYDIWIISRYRSLSGSLLIKAITGTFKKRRTELPTGIPFAFSAKFSEDKIKNQQWRAFINKNQLPTDGRNFGQVLSELKHFLIPVLEAAYKTSQFDKKWGPKKRTWE